jgi:hypothetical protein
MLDFNHRVKFHERITGLIDVALMKERRQETPRTYLGASRLGVVCERALQYEYAAAPVDAGREFPGQLLRVFAVGNSLEVLVVLWLRMAGFDVRTVSEQGQQFDFEVAGGRIAGHCDGIVMSAPPELGLTGPMLLEIKTMNAKFWRECSKKGVAVAKPVYAAQMALYQAYLSESWPGLANNPALFMAINKDTQELWFELVAFDGALAQRMSDRGVRVITATQAAELLPRTFNDPAHFECRLCAWQERCWRTNP